MPISNILHLFACHAMTFQFATQKCFVADPSEERLFPSSLGGIFWLHLMQALLKIPNKAYDTGKCLLMLLQKLSTVIAKHDALNLLTCETCHT